MRGKTLFRSKDRLFLTKSVIDSCFDLDKFKEYGLLTAFMALHDSNRGDKLNIDALQRKWVWFWSASAMDAGSACVSAPAYEGNETILSPLACLIMVCLLPSLLPSNEYS